MMSLANTTYMPENKEQLTLNRLAYKSIEEHTGPLCRTRCPTRELSLASELKIYQKGIEKIVSDTKIITSINQAMNLHIQNNQVLYQQLHPTKEKYKASKESSFVYSNRKYSVSPYS